MNAATKAYVWETPLAGRWYPANGETLRCQLHEMLPAPTPPPAANVRAVIVPHAGYAYSGPTAMAAYAMLDFTQFQRVVVIGPSHYLPMHERLSVVQADRVATPLGVSAIDTHWLDSLRTCGWLEHQPQAHLHEHSDQIQLPLVQFFDHNLNLRLAPLVCGFFDDVTAVAKCGADIRQLLDDHTLLVISTDFTHYGPNFNFVPFKVQDSATKIRQLDHQVFERLQAGDSAGLRRLIKATGATVCGVHPLLLLLAIAGPAIDVTEVAYAQSGTITGDWQNSVSYLSALVRW